MSNILEKKLSANRSKCDIITYIRKLSIYSAVKRIFFYVFHVTPYQIQDVPHFDRQLPLNLNECLARRLFRKYSEATGGFL